MHPPPLISLIPLLALLTPSLAQIIIITPTRGSPTQTASCALTRCVDYVNNCGMTYGGCYPACAGSPTPTFSDPGCAGHAPSSTSATPTPTTSSSVKSSSSKPVPPSSTSSISSTTSATKKTSTQLPPPSSTFPSTSNKSSSSTTCLSSTLVTSTKPAVPSSTVSSAAPSGTLVPPNLQCGGIGMDGYAQCTSGYECTQVNAFFWQCQPVGGGGLPGGPGSGDPGDDEPW